MLSQILKKLLPSRIRRADSLDEFRQGSQLPGIPRVVGRDAVRALDSNPEENVSEDDAEIGTALNHAAKLALKCPQDCFPSFPFNIRCRRNMLAN